MTNTAPAQDDWHHCHFCGDYVNNGVDTDGERHWLIDCRPDLVEHEPGPHCTWWGLSVQKRPGKNCYAFQDRLTDEWTDQHVHFYPKDSLT